MNVDTLMPRIRSTCRAQWRYALSSEATGVVLRTATLRVWNASGKMMFVIRHCYTTELSTDYLETKLVRLFFRFIGGV